MRFFYSDEKERIYRPNSISYSVIEYNFVPKYTVGIISDSMFPDHSLFDSLTGLYNKGKIKRIAVDVLEKAKENHTKAVFVIIDLDYFKEVNDTYGHPVGDIAIKNAARIIKNDVGHKQGKHAKQQRRRRSFLSKRFSEKYRNITHPMPYSIVLLTAAANITKCRILK